MRVDKRRTYGHRTDVDCFIFVCVLYATADRTEVQDFRRDDRAKMSDENPWNQVVDRGMKTVKITVPFYSLAGHSRTDPAIVHINPDALLETAGVAHPNALQFKSVDLTGSSIGTSVGFRCATHIAEISCCSLGVG